MARQSPVRLKLDAPATIRCSNTGSYVFFSIARNPNVPPSGCEPKLLPAGTADSPTLYLLTMGLRLLLCASLLVVACEGVPASAGSSAPAKGVPSARVAPANSSRLPTPDQERAVTSALATAGVQRTSLIPSKFAWLFGT